MKVRFVFAWYDLWVGAFWSRKDRTLYVMVPMVGIALEFGRPVEAVADGCAGQATWPEGCGWPRARFDPGSSCVECGLEIEAGTYTFADISGLTPKPLCDACAGKRPRKVIDLEFNRTALRGRL